MNGVEKIVGVGSKYMFTVRVFDFCICSKG